MAKTQYYCAASLDGYIADPDDGLGWLTGYEGTYDGPGAEPSPMGPDGSYEDFYAGVGALVSGSATYEWVIRHHADPWPYPGKPWYVLSSRELPVPEAEGVDVRVTEGDVSALYDEMLAAAGGANLWVLGGGGVASQLAAAGLLDEVLLTVVPVVLGAGKQLFDDALSSPLELLGTRTYENGMVELRLGLGSGASSG